MIYINLDGFVAVFCNRFRKKLYIHVQSCSSSGMRNLKTN